jgi:rod shape-determining protein MreB and related proteins
MAVPALALGRDLAIDLGTANVLVYARGRGIVVDEPSVVTIDTTTGKMIAAGAEAKAMIGRTPPRLTTIRPMRAGVITDFETTERLIRYLIQRVHGNRHLAKPRLVVAVPSGLTGVERRAVRDACFKAGARGVHLLEEPLAAAIGARLPVHEPRGSMVVDVGGGTTETAVVSLGGMVSVTATRVGGNDLDDALQAHIKKEYAVAIGDATAEQLKMTAGSAFPQVDELKAEVRGRDLVSGLPRTVLVDSSEIRRAIEEPMHQILDTVKATLDSCPPELAADVMDFGITVTGGGALLRGLDERIRHETGMPVQVCEEPLRTVATGAGMCVDQYETLKPVLTDAAS